MRIAWHSLYLQMFKSRISGKMGIRLKHPANIITSFRIAASLAIPFVHVFGIPFWILYGFSGATDIADGYVARKTRSESRGGAMLDSIADLVFVVVCLVKILPEMRIERWIWLWLAVIVVLKLANIAYGLVFKHRLIMPHTFANKLTGGLLFLLPMAIQWIPVTVPAIIVCSVATFAAVQEGQFIKME